MNRDPYSEQVKAILEAATEAASALGQSILGSEHLLLALLSIDHTVAFEVLTDLDLVREEVEEKLRALTSGRPTAQRSFLQITPRAERILKNTLLLAKHDAKPATSAHLLRALVYEKESLAVKLLAAFSVTPEDVLSALSSEGEEAEENRKKEPGGKSETPTLDQYAHDLTRDAREGKLDPIIGRDTELERVTQILSRRTKNNPCLIGEPGVGKTAVVEGLARRIAEGQVPDSLCECRVMTLDLTGMLAGSKYRGEFEERIKSVIDEVRGNADIILFIDEIHTLIGAGGAEGAIDAANILKPALSRGEMQVIGATTLSEYRAIEKDAALERRFQPVYVEEPSEEDARLILHGLKEKYEEHHGVKITDEAIDAAVKLSVRYIGDRFLPDKAIDLIDEAQSKVRISSLGLPDDVRALEQTLLDIREKKSAAVAAEAYEQAQSLLEGERKIVRELNEKKEEWKQKKSHTTLSITEQDIASVVTEWTKIPLERLMEEESERLKHLEKALGERVIGQEEAVGAIARAIRRSRSGLKDPRRPAGSFIFAGPTGVGKTELCKALAALLFGDENKLIRVDMSEFMEKHSVSKLIGSPPGYVGYEEGGALTEKVRRNPYSVILFDEIEKAHPDVFHLLLQMLDDGRLTDSHGRVVNFKNTILILTTNAGVSGPQKSASMGFLTPAPTKNETDKHQSDEKEITAALRRFFRPEFLNRVDEIIVFERLNFEALTRITRLLISDVEERLAEQNIRLTLSENAVEYLTREGTDLAYGARPLRRAIARLVSDPLALLLIDGTFENGDTVHVDVADNQLSFQKA